MWSSSFEAGDRLQSKSDCELSTNIYTYRLGGREVHMLICLSRQLNKFVVSYWAGLLP